MAGGQLSTILRQLRHLLGKGQADTRSEAHLLRCFLLQRDEDAFAALVQRYGPIVLSVCRRVLHDACDVEDAFQATFLILVRKAATIARPELLGPWLHGVAHRVAVRARVQAAQRLAHESRVVAGSASDPTAAVVWRELRPLLDEEVNRLPDKYRLPFILCHLEGKTNEEAARCLGCPKGTVVSRLARARERLRKRLTQRGITLSGTALVLILTENAVSATVPTPLDAAASRSALHYMAGTTAFPAAVLAEGVMKAMLLTKVKNLVALLLVLALAGAGAAVATHQALAEKQPATSTLKQSLADKEQPPEKKDEPTAIRARVDADGDPLPPDALARLGRLRFRHGEGISSLAFSPVGKILASAGHDLDPGKDVTDHTIRLWDVRTGKALTRLQCNAGNL